MRTSFKVTATDTSKTKITVIVKLDCPRFELTREEFHRYKAKTQDRAFNMVREIGYYCEQIKISKV